MTAKISGMVPPHDLDAEGAILGACLLDKGSVPIALSALRGEEFWSDSNQRIFGAIRALHEAGTVVDAVTVAGHLRTCGRLADVGGAEYIGVLADAPPQSFHVPSYCRSVAEKHRLRRLIATCQRIAAESYFDVGDVDEWVDASEATIHAIAVDRAADQGVSTAGEIVRLVMDDLWNDAAEVGIGTGIRCLDRLMGPMRPAQMITIGAHSGVGKTSLALGFAFDVALRSNRGSHTGVAMFSLEMSKRELIERAVFTVAQVDSWKLTNRKWITNDERDALTEAGHVIERVDNLWIDDRGGMTALQVRARARRIQADAKRRGTPLGLIVVDYAQLLRGSSSRKNENREQEVAEVSRAMKAMAKECNVPVIILAQLNEDAIKEKRRPRPSDLRESKALFHDSDKVLLIHNENANARASTDRTDETRPEAMASEVVEIIVGKNRGGRMGTVRINFWPSITKFGEKYASNEQHEDWTERAYG